MKRLLCSLWVFSVMIGCKPGASSAEPDSRLGVMFAQSIAVNSQPAQGAANFFSFAFDVDSQGAVHAVGTWNPTREFGSTEVTFGSSRYWRVSKDGKVDEKSGPAYATGAATRISMIIGPDDQPTLVQYNGLGAGKAVTFYSLDSSSSTWVEKSLFYSQYPAGLTASAFGDDDQVRALGGGEFVVVLQNQMLHSSGDGWVPVTFPKTAMMVHLVNVDATTVRAVWTEAGNRLATGVFSRSTWALDVTHVARVQLNGKPGFRNNFNVAGSVDAFVVDLDVDNRWASYRYAGDVLTQTDADNGMTRLPLLLTRHPTRAIRGYTTGVFQGRDTGIISELKPGVQQINCLPSTKPTGSDASPYPDSPEARKCIDRLVDIRMVPEVDVSGMVLLTFDRTQDIVTRVYVKHVPFPIPADPFFGEAPAGGPRFEGDDGGTDSSGTAQTRISGKALIVGETVHSQVTVTIASTTNGAMIETLGVADDGSYRSSVVPSGEYSLEFNCPGYAPQVRTVTVTDVEAPLETLVLDVMGVMDVPPEFGLVIGHSTSRVYRRYQKQLTFIDYEAAALKSTRISALVDAAPPLVFTTNTPNNGALISFMSVHGVQFVAPGADVALGNPGVSMTDYRFMGANSPAAPDGLVDGLPINWRSHGATIVENAADVAFEASGSTCTGTYKWLQADAGVLVSYRSNCLPNGTFVPVTGELPVLPLTHAPTQNNATVFEGKMCGEAGGYLTPCKLFRLTNGTSVMVSDKAVDWRSPRLDRVGSVGTAYTDVGAVAASNLALPAAYAADEHPAYNLSGGSMAIRTTTGFALVTPPQAAVAITANVITSFEVPGGVAFFTAAAGATDCTGGCTLEMLTASLNQPPKRTVLLANAKGDETVSQVGTELIAFGTLSWPGCPGAACSVVTRSLPDAGIQALSRGTMTEMPLPRLAPIAFERFDDVRGAWPSTWKP